ncbi:MAG: hypothetical protein IKA83_08360 [Paludibacteraceae bacterium]|nr:hypothetical protein [Paludibacteraceae bacterium]
MKLLKTSILLIISILAVSCLDEPYRSPNIRVNKLGVNSDTLSSTATPILVGDTLKLSLTLEGFVNDMEYFHINMDREYAKDSIAYTEDLLQYCNPLYTDVKDGLYYFNPGVQNMYLTLLIIPKKAKEDEKAGIPVSLSLKSKCNEGDDYNPYYLDFYYFITNKK